MNVQNIAPNATHPMTIDDISFRIKFKDNLPYLEQHCLRCYVLSAGIQGTTMVDLPDDEDFIGCIQRNAYLHKYVCLANKDEVR